MVVAQSEICSLADVIFVIEGTGLNGAYLNDIKTNYIIPTLEYFNQGNLEEREFISESTSALYGIVIYHAADRLPSPSTEIYGPYSNPHKILQLLDKIELVGGRAESHANVAEGLASALVCLEDLILRREVGLTPQKHCILICNSPPYLMPVMENQSFIGNSAEQLATILNEKSIHLSIISPRKIPAMYKLFEKAGGDLTASQTKNYAKDPRHSVLLKGYSLKERPLSPTLSNINVAPLPSPIQSHGSPIAPGAPPQTTQQSQPQAQLIPGAANPAGVVTATTPGQAGAGRGFPPAYSVRPPSSRWPMMPPQGPRYSTPGSALIEQLTRPPTSVPPQFNNSPSMNQTAGMNSQMVQQQPQQVQQPQTVPQQSQLRMLGCNQNVMGQANLGQPQQNVLPPSTQAIMGQQQNVPIVMPAGGLLPNQITPTSVMQQQAPTVQTIAQPQQQPAQGSRERRTIWQGILEWIDKKMPADAQKVPRQVPVSVSAAAKDGEPELKTDVWPSKLFMQLMPRQLIGNIGGSYLKNSKSVLFHLQPCEALEALTKIMSTGFAGCIHFSGAGMDLKVMIVLYTTDRRAFLGFVPNDQPAFVDRLRKIIQHQKMSNAHRQMNVHQAGQVQQAPGLVPQGNPQTSMPGMLQQTPFSQQPTQPITSALGGATVGQPTGQMMGTVQGDQSQQQGTSQAGPYNTQLVEARQENLVKIQKLRQTLEAAQQQELQFKNQFEIMNQMKMQPMQDTVGMHPGQTQDQFKAQLELNLGLQQEQQKQLRAQLQHMQQQQQQQQQQQVQQQQQQQQMRGMAPVAQQAQGQQRLMRPALSNNPGLRHLLQQPQYRMNMQQQMPRAGMPTQQGQPNAGQQPQFDDVTSYDFLG